MHVTDQPRPQLREGRVSDISARPHDRPVRRAAPRVRSIFYCSCFYCSCPQAKQNHFARSPPSTLVAMWTVPTGAPKPTTARTAARLPHDTHVLAPASSSTVVKACRVLSSVIMPRKDARDLPARCRLELHVASPDACSMLAHRRVAILGGERVMNRSEPGSRGRPGGRGRRQPDDSVERRRRRAPVLH
jgi:hypothetical protein